MRAGAYAKYYLDAGRNDSGAHFGTKGLEYLFEQETVGDVKIATGEMKSALGFSAKQGESLLARKDEATGLTPLISRWGGKRISRQRLTEGGSIIIGVDTGVGGCCSAWGNSRKRPATSFRGEGEALAMLGSVQSNWALAK